MSDAEEDVRKALEEVLKMYDIELDLESESDEMAKERRYGDYSDMISKTQEKLDELNEKAEEIYKRTGMTEEQLEAYASNPSNFTKEQWEGIQKVKEACDKYKHEARAHIGEEQFTEKVEKKKAKKQPHRFAKKKNWIPL